MWFGFSQGWGELREVTDHIDGWLLGYPGDVHKIFPLIETRWKLKACSYVTGFFSLQFLKEVSFGKLTLFSNETINVYMVYFCTFHELVNHSS